jgi:hypothetical protein
MKLGRGTLLFLIGLALGAVLVVIGPRVAGPYLPEAFRGKVESVEVLRVSTERCLAPLMKVGFRDRVHELAAAEVREFPLTSPAKRK